MLLVAAHDGMVQEKSQLVHRKRDDAQIEVVGKQKHQGEVVVGIGHKKETAVGKTLPSLAGDLNLGQRSNKRAQTSLLLDSFFQLSKETLCSKKDMLHYENHLAGQSDFPSSATSTGPEEAPK